MKMKQSIEACNVRTTDRSGARFPFLMIVAMAAVLAGGAWRIAAAADQAEPAVARPHDEYRYYYYDEPKPLPLDGTRIAVHVGDPGQVDWRDRLQAFDLDDRAVSPHAVQGWHLVSLGENAKGSERIRPLVNQLVADDAGGFDFVSPVFVDQLGGPLIITPYILLRFHDEIGAAQAEDVLAARELDVLDADWAGMAGAYRVRSRSLNGFEVLEQANLLARSGETIFAEPDVIFTGRSASTPPNDPYFPRMWGLHNTGQFIGFPCSASGGTPGMDVGALNAWKITKGDPSIIIVVLDDGIQMDHPDLNADPSLGADFTGQGGGGWPVNHCDNHGTPVAGCSVAKIDNSLGGVGVAPESLVASARPFISNVPCDGGWSSFASWTVNALAWAEDIVGARVSNNSNWYGFTSPAIASKYALTKANGMMHFASAGNNSSSTITYPASLASVNAVAALDRNGTLAPFSNWGVGLAFSAPGRFIITTDRTGSDGYVSGDYMCFNGTSAASPYAAGVAALILSQCPGLSADEVEQYMQDGAIDLGTPGYNTTFGWGLVNAAGSLALISTATGDLTGDCSVGVADLLILLSEWGPCADCDGCPADLDGDCNVGVSDLLILLANWG